MMQSAIDIKGAVDLHVHCGPSLFARRVDGYELAVQAAQAGMDGIVMKEHHLPTVYGVSYVEKLLDQADEDYDIEVMGSAVMNYCVGGFNPFLVQTAIDYGAEVIWAPTIDARNHGQKTGGVGQYLGRDDIGDEYRDVTGLYALNDEGELMRDVRLCLDKIAENDVIFSVGHLTYEETKRMVDYLADQGHEKIVVDHPNFHITDFDSEQQHELVDAGAFVNFQFASVSPKFYWQSPGEVVETVADLGIGNCVISSDMGQVANPSAPEGLRIFGELLLEEGMTEEEYQTVIETNPKWLLGWE
jgi:hypothetical protein